MQAQYIYCITFTYILHSLQAESMSCLSWQTCLSIKCFKTNIYSSRTFFINAFQSYILQFKTNVYAMLCNMNTSLIFMVLKNDTFLSARFFCLFSKMDEIEKHASTKQLTRISRWQLCFNVIAQYILRTLIGLLSV